MDEAQDNDGVEYMNVIGSRPVARQRWQGETVLEHRPELVGFAHRPGHGGGGPRPDALPAHSFGELNLAHDFVAGALAEDARGEGRELWLGLLLACGVVALFVSGQGINTLAVLFCLAPLVGIGLEIFGSKE